MSTRSRAESKSFCRAFAPGWMIATHFWVTLASAKPNTEVLRSAADELFERGKSALKAGDWEGGCEHFRHSQALDPSASAMVKIARCYEHEHDPKNAWMAYDTALVLVNQRPRDATHTRELIALIQTAQKELAQGLGRITIRRPTQPLELAISIDAQPITGAASEQPMPLEPGLHRIEARANGYLPKVVEIQIVAGTLQELDVSLDPVPSQQAAARLPPSPGTIVGKPLPTSDAARVKSRDGTAAPWATSSPRSVSRSKSVKGQRTWGVITGATGAVFLGVAGYLGWRTRTLVDNARVDNHCDADFSCDALGMDKIHSAERAQLQTVVAAAGGVVLLGTSIALFVTAGTQHAQSGNRQLHLLLTPVGTAVEGNF